jgi:hypothetical protein
MKLDTVVVALPEQIKVVSLDEKQTLSVPNKHRGEIVLPAIWTGADFDAHFQAGREAAEGDPHPWQRQWQWAKARVVEWRIDELPSNPNQLDDGALPFALQRWIYRQAAEAMTAYGDSMSDVARGELTIPTAADLTADEFFRWEAALEDQPEDDRRAGLLQSWSHARLLVRDWGSYGERLPGGSQAEAAYDDASGMSVDLGLIIAVSESVIKLVNEAMHLGNWPGPRGGR